MWVLRFIKHICFLNSIGTLRKLLMPCIKVFKWNGTLNGKLPVMIKFVYTEWNMYRNKILHFNSKCITMLMLFLFVVKILFSRHFSDIRLNRNMSLRTDRYVYFFFNRTFPINFHIIIFVQFCGLKRGDVFGFVWNFSPFMYILWNVKNIFLKWLY